MTTTTIEVPATFTITYVKSHYNGRIGYLATCECGTTILRYTIRQINAACNLHEADYICPFPELHKHADLSHCSPC